MTKTLSDRAAVLGVVLAGGRSRRMQGKDKTDLHWRGQSLLDRMIDRAAPQVDQLVISSNSLAQPLYRSLPVIRDPLPDYPGPLAGIAGALAWQRKEAAHCDWLATFATDTPFVPTDFVAACLDKARVTRTDAVYACYGDKHHYAMALWHTSLQPYLLQRLEAGERALKNFLAELNAQPVAFDSDPAAPYGDPFFNINTPDDWQLAQSHLDAEVIR